MNISDFTDNQVERSIQGALRAVKASPRVQVMEYGVNYIGNPQRIGYGGWERVDTYVSASDGKPVRERRFCAGPSDFSDMATGYNGNHYKGNVEYNSACSCCYLGFSHTVEYHNRSIGKHSPLTCPRCARGTSAFGLCPECQKGEVRP